MRRYDIDWLRIFGIALLFPFHVARVFDPYELNYVQSAVKLQGMSMFMTDVWPFFMPLMFMVAGISAFYALQKRTSQQFMSERVHRLLIPLVLGILLIVPIQGYMARLQQGTLSGGYLHYFFTQFLPDFSDISGYRGTFTPAHLWFILYLFLISWASLSLCVKIRNQVREGKIGRFGRLFQKGWFYMLLFIPVTISEALPDIGGKNPFFYAMYYLLGYMFAAYNGWGAIGKIKWQSLTIAVVGLPVYVYLVWHISGYGDFAWQSILLGLIRNSYGMSVLLAMLAFAQKYINRGSKVLTYLSGAAFPVYILHQSVMMVLAYFILKWPVGIGLQYVLIAGLTLVASLALYELFRRIRPLRVVLGIKEK